MVKFTSAYAIWVRKTTKAESNPTIGYTKSLNIIYAQNYIGNNILLGIYIL